MSDDQRQSYETKGEQYSDYNTESTDIYAQTYEKNFRDHISQ